MKIKFLGAAGTVTGSSYVLSSDSGQSILIDLGMFQGIPEIDKLNYEPYDYDCSQLSAAILTHAHLDHCGRLPILMTRGFKGNIFMTAPTRDLTELSLIDSANIAKYNKKKSLYSKKLAQNTIKRFKIIDYHTPLKIGSFTINIVDAGHILGSTSLEIVDTHSSSEVSKIVFSGDLGNSPANLVRELEFIDSADVVVMESTYGDRIHPKQNPSDIIQSEINTVENTNGTLLMPAFSLDRTQELMHLIMHLKSSGKIRPETPIFMDSPMGERATTIYRGYPDLFNQHAQKELRSGTLFNFPGLNPETELLTGARVIIAGSGMMTGGRILEHARNYLPITSTRLLIVGYQGEGTLGREILDGKRNVVINGLSITITASVTETKAMSSHADQDLLVKWLGHIKDTKKVILTHGEDDSRKVLSKEISQKLGLTDVTLPTLNQQITL